MTDLSDIGWVAVVGLAAFRLWVLVSTDNILARPRAALPSRVVTFLACPWCAGFWIALGLFFVADEWGDEFWVRAVIVILAVSAVVGAFAVWTGEDVSE